MLDIDLTRFGLMVTKGCLSRTGKRLNQHEWGGGFKVKDSQAGCRGSKDSRLPPPDVVDAPHQPWVKVPKLLLEDTRR